MSKLHAPVFGYVNARHLIVLWKWGLLTLTLLILTAIRPTALFSIHSSTRFVGHML